MSIRKPHRKSHDCFYYKLAVNVLQKKNCHYVRFSTTLAVIPAANRDSSPLAKSKARCTSDVERRCPCTVPADPQGSDAAISASRFAVIDGSPFDRGDV